MSNSTILIQLIIAFIAVPTILTVWRYIKTRSKGSLDNSNISNDDDVKELQSKVTGRIFSLIDYRSRVMMIIHELDSMGSNQSYRISSASKIYGKIANHKLNQIENYLIIFNGHSDKLMKSIDSTSIDEDILINLNSEITSMNNDLYDLGEEISEIENKIRSLNLDGLIDIEIKTIIEFSSKFSNKVTDGINLAEDLLKSIDQDTYFSNSNESIDIFYISNILLENQIQLIELKKSFEDIDNKFNNLKSITDYDLRDHLKDLSLMDFDSELRLDLICSIRNKLETIRIYG